MRILDIVNLDDFDTSYEHKGYTNYQNDRMFCDIPHLDGYYLEIIERGETHLQGKIEDKEIRDLKVRL